jgi:dGTPase
VTEQLPLGYGDEDFEQYPSGAVASPHADDVRTPFQHDIDRILYSAEFRSLAGKTQVVSADQLGSYHNRLTHSLKVAQIGRRLGPLLTARAAAEGTGEIGPDSDLLEAACMLHDIGHPPFGHIGERSLRQTVDELYKAQLPERTTPEDPISDGFQGNAQNLRIATYLSARGGKRGERGLGLTRATLDAATKYPWHRGSESQEYAAEHWGCYATEDQAIEWLVGAVQHSPGSKKDAETRPVEEQIMDWADEVTYACHDLEDFYRAGIIPLDRILGLPPEDNRRQVGFLPYETEQFFAYLDLSSEEAAEAEMHLRELQNKLFLTPYEGTLADKQASAKATSRLITLFLSDVKLESTSLTKDGVLTRYGATLDVPASHKAKVRLLRKLIFFYVIDRPGLAGQQHGQKRIIRDLASWVAAEPERLLPPDRKEEWLADEDAIRASADYVASLTELQAVRLHHRMSGVDYGQITDSL